jgi:hypothetical protein
MKDLREDIMRFSVSFPCPGTRLFTHTHTYTHMHTHTHTRGCLQGKPANLHLVKHSALAHDLIDWMLTADLDRASPYP